jgi:hypothetical protein
MEILLIGLFAILVIVGIVLTTRKKEAFTPGTTPGNTPVKKRKSYPFGLSPSFNGVIYNPKAEVDADGKYYLSFGQASPAKGITVKGKEWAGTFSVYVAKDGEVMQLGSKIVKKKDEYLWEKSGKLGFKPTGNIGFFIKKS